MNSLKNIKISFKTLRVNKLRTFLAIMGITIGVAAVIIMVAIGQGAQQKVEAQIQRLGTNLFTIKAAQVRKMINRQQQSGDVTTLTVHDAQAILDIPHVVATAPVQSRSVKVKYKTITSNLEVVGSTGAIETLRNYRLEAGRFFDKKEERAGIRVAVIGYDVYKNLFKGTTSQFKKDNPIGEIIRVGRVPFEVIGLLKPIGTNAEGGNEDNRILVPLRTALRRVFNVRHLGRIYVQVDQTTHMPQVETGIRELLRQRHGLTWLNKTDDFTLHNSVTALEMERQSGNSFTLLITAMAAISLLVGGAGILAIMLLSVKERTPEIGLRMALGARSKDILKQFLTEAILMGAFGGLLGIVLGTGGIWVIGNITPLNTIFPLPVMGIALVFSLTIGLFFGVYPARKAAQLNPIEALRAD